MCLYPLIALRWKRGAPKKREVEIISSLEHQLIEYRCKDFESLKKKFYSNPAIFNGWLKEVLLIDCGQCAECRLNKSREWANRCVIEAQQYPKDTCFFITLTYDDEHLPPGGCEFATVEKDAISVFMKNLRRYWQYHYNFPEKSTEVDENGMPVPVPGIRFYGVSEYGDKSGRPHYHVILFNIPHLVDHLKYYKANFRGDVYYKCPLLDSIWKNGLVTVAEVNWETCAYVARYVMKKRTGFDSSFYEENGICPEYSVMSRNPGIGRNGYDEDKILNSEFILPGRKKALVVQSIGYYDRLFKEAHSDELVSLPSFDDPEDSTYETSWESLQRRRKERAEERLKQKSLKTSANQVSELRCRERKRKKNIKKLVRLLD